MLNMCLPISIFMFLMSLTFAEELENEPGADVVLKINVTVWDTDYLVTFRQAFKIESFECLCSQTEPKCVKHYENELFKDLDKSTPVPRSPPENVDCSVSLNNGGVLEEGFHLPQCEVSSVLIKSDGCYLKMSIFYQNDVVINPYYMSCLCNAYVIPASHIVPDIPFYVYDDMVYNIVVICVVIVVFIVVCCICCLLFYRYVRNGDRDIRIWIQQQTLANAPEHSLEPPQVRASSQPETKSHVELIETEAEVHATPSDSDQNETDMTEACTDLNHGSNQSNSEQEPDKVTTPLLQTTGDNEVITTLLETTGDGKDQLR